MLSVSLIIPTYNEAQNLPFLMDEIFSALDRLGIDLEIIVVDDNSPDKTAAVAEELAIKYPIKVIKRTGKLGLGSAVCAGFAASDRPYLGVMDADLSHDPAILNSLVYSLSQSDIAIGSRFEDGSSIEKWTWWRQILSGTGVALAKLLTKSGDPLSGYFFFKRAVIENVNLTTKGYKILLEILVKGNYKNIIEKPYKFRMRKFSTSKLNMQEYFLFLKQLAQYSLFKIFKK